MRSRSGYWIGGGLVAAGVVGAVLWLVLSLVRLGDEVDDFQRAPVPGTADVQLEARKYVVYYEGAGAEDAVPSFQIAIVDARTGAPLDIASYGGSLTYDLGGYEGSAQGTVTPAEAGTYTVRTEGGGAGAQVALGRSIAGPLVRTIVGAFAIGALLVGAGVILLVLTGVRRSRARRAQPAAAPPPPAWPP